MAAKQVAILRYLAKDVTERAREIGRKSALPNGDIPFGKVTGLLLLGQR